jgi:peptidoglycan L-alanyl-D-glutamate endopeptidase CwlK
MLASRDLNLLEPCVKLRCELFIKGCTAIGIDVLITSTYRDYESQQALYEQGRKVPGPKVTNAMAGYSYHNFKCAFDFVPMKNGKCVWDDDKLFTQCGDVAKGVGLEWAGDWTSFKEKAHCQYTGGLSLEQLRAGRKVGELSTPVPIQVGG